MKKITKIMAVLLMAIVVAVTAAACGSSSIVGKTFELNPDACDFGDMVDEQQAAALDMMKWTMYFKSEDTCVMKLDLGGLASLMGSSGEGASQEEECTYTLKDGVITITDKAGTDMEMKLDGSALVMEEDGAKIVFTAK